jgi:hypothetical protein
MLMLRNEVSRECVARDGEKPAMEQPLEDYSSICKEAAQRFGVVPDVHPEDFLFRFLLDNPVFESKDQAISHYFDDGAKSAEKLRRLLSEVCELSGRNIELLEFASGFGRVTRHLTAALPTCRTTACDIHPSAIQFLRERLGADAIVSESVPERLIPHRTFDVAFALSFFSHMPKQSFSRWIQTLSSFVRPSGFMIFTTHGITSLKTVPDWKFDADGFFFYPASDQKDLDSAEYGTAYARPQYVLDLAFSLPQLRLRYFHEGFWWGHQDLYVFQVMPSPMPGD